VTTARPFNGGATSVYRATARRRATPAASSRAPDLAGGFLSLLGVVLLGYALAGRGFAYVGVPPLFVGELTLAVGLVAMAYARGWQQVLRCRLVWPVLALGAWGLARTLPFVGEHGVASLRDAVVWGYAASAIIVATLVVERPARLAGLVLAYRRFVPLFLIGAPIAFVVYRFLGKSLPQWPWADVGVLQVKEGDVLVHLAGIMAFWVAGLARGQPHWMWVALLTGGAAAMGVIDRAGMLSFGAVFALSMVRRPSHPLAWRAVGAAVAAMAVLWVTDVRVPVPGGKGREVSFDQIVTNLASVARDTGADGLDSTKEWRLQWWSEIVNYTFGGPYFWGGKGFGINLADDDGFQVLSDNSLRSPHNVHMTMLARAGVPGLALWAAAQLLWGAAMVAACRRSLSRGQHVWEGLFFFLLAYWLAFLINGSFDVFLEGPMGGVWFWTIYGAGIGALLVQQRVPQALDAIAVPRGAAA